MVINYNIAGYIIHNVSVDNGSAAYILTENAFVKMSIDNNNLRPSTNPLCGFGGKKVDALGKIPLMVSFGQGQNSRVEEATFDVIDINYPYNAIVGQPTLTVFKAVIHPTYLAIKIPSNYQTITVFGSQEDARKAEGS